MVILLLNISENVDLQGTAEIFTVSVFNHDAQWKNDIISACGFTSDYWRALSDLRRNTEKSRKSSGMAAELSNI